MPRRALDDLLPLLGETDVTFTRGENHLFFDCGAGRRLVSRVVDGQYPSWRRLIPALDAARCAEVDRAALATALRRVGLVSDGAKPCVRLDIGTGAVSISARSAEVGDAAEAIPATLSDGHQATVQVSASYVLDFLEAAGSERVTVETNGEDRATVWQPVGGDVTYVGLVMPVR